MGNNHGKTSQTVPVNLRTLACEHKHGASYSEETTSQSQLSWFDLAHNVSGRLSAFSERISNITSLSWRSGRSTASCGTATRSSWPRGSRKRSCDATALDDQLLTRKTTWPVSLVESFFLPEFPIRHKHSERQFDVVAVLGSGSYGKVFHVKSKQLDQHYALKVLSKSQVVREKAIRQVKDEVCIQTACGHHRFIVGCPQRWQNRKQLFVLEDYVPGGDMYALWHRHGALQEELVQLFVAELALALDFLHNAGVVYRDLKLENVLLDCNMHVQLTDFGLAKWLRHGNRTHTVCGTIRYMAPEVLDMQPYTHAVDWWSLGVLAYCLLAGDFPFGIDGGGDDDGGDGGGGDGGGGDGGCGDQLAMRRTVFTARGPLQLPSAVTRPARQLVARLLTHEPRHRLNSVLKLTREAWYSTYDMEAVKRAQVNPRALYERLYPHPPTDGQAPSAPAASDDFIDFDASTVDDSLGSAELLDEFPRLSSPPTPSKLPLGFCSSTPSASGTSGGGAAARREVQPLEFCTSTPCNGATELSVPASCAEKLPGRACADTFDETSSGDILELNLPAPIAEDRAEMTSPVAGGGVQWCAEDDPFKRAHSLSNASREEYERVWKRARNATNESSEEWPSRLDRSSPLI